MWNFNFEYEYLSSNTSIYQISRLRVEFNRISLHPQIFRFESSSNIWCSNRVTTNTLNFSSSFESIESSNYSTHPYSELILLKDDLIVKFDVNDNIILLVAYTSRLSAWLLRAFAKTSQVFYASTGAAVLGMITSAPIRWKTWKI